MGKVYAPPKHLVVPEFTSGERFDEYDKKCEKFVSDVKAWAKKNGKGTEAGKEIQFPVGDGCARYVIVSLKPIKLIHLPVGDAWQFQYIERLTANDIRNRIINW